MTVREVYAEAIKGKHYSLRLLIEFLVYEKKVLSFSDDQSKLNRYLLEKHSEKMNKLLADYEVKINERVG
jgi:hypothetical protein